LAAGVGGGRESFAQNSEEALEEEFVIQRGEAGRRGARSSPSLGRGGYSAQTSSGSSLLSPSSVKDQLPGGGSSCPLVPQPCSSEPLLSCLSASPWLPYKSFIPYDSRG